MKRGFHMNDEKICPLYSAPDNTARKCIKEECGWWCDQHSACAVVAITIKSDHDDRGEQP